jgi:hypothetical protein
MQSNTLMMLLIRVYFVLAFIHTTCSTSKTQNLVSIKKPYEIVFLTTTTITYEETTAEPDQNNVECPLPYMSSSRETGCKCRQNLK